MGREKNPARRAWYKADLKRRETLTLRDIGVWAHYIGDAAQPLHDTVHYNGWDSEHYPNPKGFTNDRIHGPFEENFVRDHVSIEMVRARLPAPRQGGAIDKRTVEYLLAASRRSSRSIRCGRTATSWAPRPRGPISPSHVWRPGRLSCAT